MCWTALGQCAELSKERRGNIAGGEVEEKGRGVLKRLVLHKGERRVK